MSKDRAAQWVIVGAGQAGLEAAATLRENGFEGRLVMLGDEDELPYARPPLSKQFLAGTLERERLLLRPAAFYDEMHIECRRGARVQAIERDSARVHLADGGTLAYERLLLATGARARRLTVPGAAHPEVLSLRSVHDSLALRARLGRGRRLVVIGGGYLGLEVAASARQLGLEVSVLEAAPRLLQRVSTEPIAEYIAGVHRERGVHLHLGVQVQAIVAAGDGALRGVQLAGRGVLPADVVLVGVGALPNDELARAAGLPCDDGILVDEAMRTADPLIHAAGDCTRHPSAYAGRHIRLESVQNAIDQGHAAALAMLGRPEPAARVPWFWSQQFDLKLQTAGLPGGHDRIEHAGEPAAGRFALRYYRGERLLAVDAINLPGEYLQARKALTRQLEAQLAPRAEPAHARPADANALQTP